MKILNIYKSIGVVALAATLLVSCSELEFDIPVEPEVALTSGSADFFNYVDFFIYIWNKFISSVL